LSKDKLRLTKENLQLSAKLDLLEEKIKEEAVGAKLPLPE